MKRSRILIFTLCSLCILAVAVLLSLAIGARNVPFTELAGALHSGSADPLYGPILQKRILRTILGIMVGAALGCAGGLMQSVTRNPIADPSILGVNAGASLAVVAGMAFVGLHTTLSYIVFAMFGALAASIFVYGIASIASAKGGPGPIRLALSGAATSTACSSIVSTIMLPRTNVMEDFRFWQVGSLRANSVSDLLTVLPFLLAGFLFAMLLAPSLNILALGDEAATGLGVNTRLVRGLASLAGVLLCGATTTIAGPIGFVGLMVPHLVRIVIGSDLRLQLPLSAIHGAALLLCADVIGRVLGRPGELEVGIVTAFIGAPIFIIIVRRGRRLSHE